MDAFGLGDIHLKCDIPFIKLERLSCREKVNEHTTICRYTCRIGNKKMDVDCKTFVFQKTDQNYGDFFKEISEPYYGSCIILDEQIGEERLRYPIVQYKETDWEFIKRIAFCRNLEVITDSRQEKPRYFWGNNKADVKAVAIILGWRKWCCREVSRFGSLHMKIMNCPQI